MNISKERKLLKRALASLDKLEPHSDVIYILCKRIQELLAQPEPEQDTLTLQQEIEEYKRGYAMDNEAMADLHVILSSLDRESGLYDSMLEAIHIIELVNDGELVTRTSRNEYYD